MRGRANGAFAVPVLVREKRCNGALIPSTAAERSARPTPADGRGRPSPPAKPRRLGVLLGTAERLLPLPLPEGRIESLKFCLPRRLAGLRSCRSRLRPRCECASPLTCAAAAPPRGSDRRRWLLGAAWGCAGLCWVGHSVERVAWEPEAARESIERESVGSCLQIAAAPSCLPFKCLPAEICSPSPSRSLDKRLQSPCYPPLLTLP